MSSLFLPFNLAVLLLEVRHGFTVSMGVHMVHQGNNRLYKCSNTSMEVQRPALLETYYKQTSSGAINLCREGQNLS